LVSQTEYCLDRDGEGRSLDTLEEKCGSDAAPSASIASLLTPPGGSRMVLHFTAIDQIERLRVADQHDPDPLDDASEQTIE
jgi:hypothetical protein